MPRRPARRAPRPAFVVTAVAALGSACSASSAPTGQAITRADDAGTQPSANPTDCPLSAPIVGAKCTSTSRCSYDDPCPLHPAGADRYAVACQSGKWAVDHPAYSAPCPHEAPVDGSPCLCAAHMATVCPYDMCPTKDEAQITAICDEKSGTWLNVLSECNPPPPQ